VKNTENNNNDNSIGFFETIEILILYKKHIFIFFIILFLLSSAYVYLSKKQNLLTNFSFSSITGIESKEINKLNYLINEIQSSRLIKQTLILSGSNIIEHDNVFSENIIYGDSSLPKITAKDLFDYYYVLINSKSIHERANNEFLKKYPNKVLPNVLIRVPKTTESGIPFFNLEVSHQSQEIIDEYSNILFQETKKETLNVIHENIEQTKLLFSNNQEKAIQSLKDQNIILSTEFKNKMKEIVLNLQEQAKIARKMKLAMPPELSQSENILSRVPVEYADGPTSTALIFNSSANYNYLRGYISLEEEISLIKKRNNAEDFVPIIRNNIQAINKLSNEAFGVHQIGELDEFDVSLLIFYNLTDKKLEIMKYYMGLKKNIFIAFFSLFGIFLGIIFSILNYSYKKYKLANN